MRSLPLNAGFPALCLVSHGQEARPESLVQSSWKLPVCCATVERSSNPVCNETGVSHGLVPKVSQEQCRLLADGLDEKLLQQRPDEAGTGV